MSPRAFERPAVIALPEGVARAPGQALDGLFVPSESGRAGAAVIAPPHPLMGGSMESPVVGEIAWACQKAGLATLRFDWRGVGASAGEPSDASAQADEDYAAALAFMRATQSGPILAAGYSFGAAAAARAALLAPAPRPLLLVAPPESLIDEAALGGYTNEVLIAAGEADHWVSSQQLERLGRSLASLRVEILPGCDHFFMNGLDALRRCIEAWLDAVGVRR